MTITASKKKTYFARSLRANQTSEEKLLWEELRNRKFKGLKFRRQQAIGIYIVDFVCFEIKLIIELDGGYHRIPGVSSNDNLRTNYLNKQGFVVLRFWNSDILSNMNEVLEKIYQLISSPQPSPKRRGRPMNNLLSPSIKWRGGKGGEA